MRNRIEGRKRKEVSKGLRGGVEGGESKVRRGIGNGGRGG